MNANENKNGNENENENKNEKEECNPEDTHGQPHYAYFCNCKCEYFPCHKLPADGFFNCLFCYCPLYALGDKCGGNFKYLPGGVKDCSACTIPHSKAGYAYITRKYPELMELAKRKEEEKQS